MTDDRSRQVREAAAQRYAAWVRGRMDDLGWNAATLSRRSGLKKQTIAQIIRGEATQPTAWQVAAIAHAFQTEPNDIFELVGLWEPEGTLRQPPPQEIADLYRRLGFIERRAWAKVGRVLVESQSEYRALRHDPDEPLPTEPRAAYSEPIPPLEEEE